MVVLSLWKEMTAPDQRDLVIEADLVLDFAFAAEIFRIYPEDDVEFGQIREIECSDCRYASKGGENEPIMYGKFQFAKIANYRSVHVGNLETDCGSKTL